MYRGPAAAGDLLQHMNKESQRFDIKSQIFDRFFKVNL